MRGWKRLLIKLYPKRCILIYSGDQDSGDARAMRHPPRIAVHVKCSWPDPTVCVTDGRAREVDLPKPFGSLKIIRESQILQNMRLHCGAFVLLQSDCSYALVLPASENKIYNLGLILQEPTLKKL